MTRTPFESLAWLHAPAADPEACAIVEADEGWRPRFAAGATAVVWGRMPARRLALSRAIGFAAARERSIRALKAGGRGLRHWSTWRIPPIGRRPALQARVRSALLSGAVVRLGSGQIQPRVADRIAEEAGHRAGELRLRVSGDGSTLARVARPGEPAALLRLATVGGLKDATRNSDALERLGAAGVAHVPRLQGAGTTLGVTWSVEDELAGTPVETLDAGLLAEIVEWAATLPRSDGPALARALEERLELISASFPGTSGDVRLASARATALAREVPGILEHGDLWTGNLLARDRRLGGVVDWDNWHPAGVPGSDLLHVLAMRRRAATGQELGELLLERPWAGEEFRSATAGYWPMLGLALTDELAWLAGLGWWAAHVTASLRRGRRPADDPAWIARNVENVTPLLAAGH